MYGQLPCQRLPISYQVSAAWLLPANVDVDNAPVAVSLVKVRLGNLRIRECRKNKQTKINTEIKACSKSAVNNGETIWTQSRFESGHYMTSILQCKELYSVANHFPPNICNNNFQIFLLIMKQTDFVECWIWHFYWFLVYLIESGKLKHTAPEYLYLSFQKREILRKNFDGFYSFYLFWWCRFFFFF